MISINDIRLLSCFNINEYKENPAKIKVVQFKKNDDINDCLLAPCRYWTYSEEIAQTIKNIPPINPNISFHSFGVKTFRILDGDFSHNIIQRTFFCGKEWRRCYLNLHEKIWGEWTNINTMLDYILNNGDIQKNLTESWTRYMVIDKNNCRRRSWAGSITTIDEIIKQIKTGTAKIYKNKLV
ncbi:MAG: hypothetical protein LBO80_02835 [Treponema sp.]|jgi:hypothetical protein|nr:hypothetical protein [Treponema sp.]